MQVLRLGRKCLYLMSHLHGREGPCLSTSWFSYTEIGVTMPKEVFVISVSVPFVLTKEKCQAMILKGDH